MRGQIRQRAHIVAMSPRADPPASRTRNDSPRYLYFYCEEIRLGDDTCQTQFGCIRQKNRTVTHSENNTSQMITNCPSFTKSAQEPENVPFSSKVRMSPLWLLFASAC